MAKKLVCIVELPPRPGWAGAVLNPFLILTENFQSLTSSWHLKSAHFWTMIYHDGDVDEEHVKRLFRQMKKQGEHTFYLIDIAVFYVGWSEGTNESAAYLPNASLRIHSFAEIAIRERLKERRRHV